MIIKSQVLGHGIKITGLTALAAVLCFGNSSIIIQSSYAQFSEQLERQQEEEQAAWEGQVASDGGLTATINGETFGKGDTVSVTGTVQERGGSASMYATIIDPDGIDLGTDSINVGSDMTFRYGFVAGEDISDMTKTGTYTIQIQYFPPRNADEESVSLDFEYNPETSVAAQTEQGIGTEGTTTESTTTFQNLTEGFRIQVPNGWVADDLDVPDSVSQAFIASNGLDILGRICPQEKALPKIGGLYDCANVVSDGVNVIYYPNLDTKPEFASVINQNQNITLNDLIAYDMEQERKSLPNPDDASRLSLESQTDTTVNLVDPITNQTVQTLPAKEVVYGLPDQFNDETLARYRLLILADNGHTGYGLVGDTEENIALDEGMPTFVRQAFDSFELLTPSSRPNVTSPLSSQELSQQQLVQSAGGLTARLNANNFTTGDTITVNGTVKDRAGGSYVTITIVDPRGETVEFDQPRVTADNTFTYSSVAGEAQEFLPQYQMVVSGNYLMQVQHGADVVEFTFHYNASEATSNATATATVSPSSPIQQEQQQLVQSAGGLTARLNANNFTTGDTITVNGTVKQRGPNAAVLIDVTDPQGDTVMGAIARVTADNMFTHSVEAGKNDGFVKQMKTSGNYLMGVQYGADRVEFIFHYNNTSEAASNATATATTPPASATQQQQPQNQGGSVSSTSVSIVSGSSGLTDTAFSPNPVQASIGDTITWTNNDAQPHTVVSGSNGLPDGKFDSSPNFNPLIAPEQTFEHTFTEVGEYPYYCALHPNMVGTVVVN